ncbi:MAG: phytoene desaturase family protein [Promethearchaeota archaeon]
MKEKSIIIIGAGLAGLSTGCYAQMNGYKTQIFEMHDIPGGLCTSWKRKGYVFDGCIHYLSGSSSGIFHRFYEELGAVQGRQIVDHEEILRIEGTSGKIWKVYSNLDRLEQHMKELSQADSRIIEELCKKARLLSRFKVPVDKPMENMGLLDMLKMLKSMRAMMTMRKYGKISMQNFAARFKDPLLRSAFPLILEDIPDYPMTLVLMPLAYSHIKNNGWPIGGSLEFARAIEKRYLDLGGKILYNSPVEKILVKADRAVGIRLSNGNEYHADLVISAADGRTTIFDMLDGNYIDDKIHQYYEEWDIYRPYIQISLGVACDFSKEPHSLVLEVDEPLKVGDQMRKWISIRHFCFDPTMAPSGKSVIVVAFNSVNYDYWKELSRDIEKYKVEKQALADDVINILEKRFPNIREKIEVVDVATPVTYERYTNNWQGSYMGWKADATDMSKLMKRTLPGLESFYMAGQWVFQGGGVPGAITSGRHLIQVICKKDKKRFIVINS